MFGFWLQDSWFFISKSNAAHKFGPVVGLRGQEFGKSIFLRDSLLIGS